MRRIVLILLTFVLATGSVLAVDCRVGGKITDTAGNRVENVVLLLIPAEGSSAATAVIRIKSGKFVSSRVAEGEYYPEMKDKNLKIVKFDFEARGSDRELVREFVESPEPGQPASSFTVAPLTQYAINLVVERIEPAK
jgi:hypothetical protein